MELSQIILTVMVAIIAAAPGIVALIAGRKKSDAETNNIEMQADKLRVETSDIILKATNELSQQYKVKIQELEAVAGKLHTRIDDLQTELRDAYIEIRRLNEALKQSNRGDR
jgi:flagellar basal body-associated protein FliL